MKFTNIKKNRSISKRIGAISMAALIGFTPVSLLNFANRPSVAAESEKQEEYKPASLNGSLVGIESLFYKIYDEMTTPIEVSTKTTSSTSTMVTTATTTTTTESTTTTEMTTTITEVTTTETEKTTEAETTTEVATTVEEVVEEPTEPAREYVVYKPSTHYIHRSTCRWFDSECYEIEDTEGLECRRCSECNPEMEIVTEYVDTTPQQSMEPAVTNNDGGYYSLNFITDVERIYLCNVVGTEYGSDGVSLYDKACVVATVMNRVHDGGWTNGKPSTIYNVLTAPYQYNPAYAVPYYRYNVTQSVIDSVEYYFQHQDEFPHYTSFCGDGRRNYFR